MAQANHTSGNKNSQHFLPLISQKLRFKALWRRYQSVDSVEIPLRGAVLGAVVCAGLMWGLYNSAIGMIFSFAPAMLAERACCVRCDLGLCGANRGRLFELWAAWTGSWNFGGADDEPTNEGAATRKASLGNGYIL
jgi:hypothetical protein